MPDKSTIFTDEEKRAIVVRVYAEKCERGNYWAGESFLDGVFFVLRSCGATDDRIEALEAELADMLDSYIQGEWEE